MRLVLSSLLLMASVSLGSQGQARDPGQVRDTGRPASAAEAAGQASITGIVTTDEQAPRPLRNVRVTLSMANTPPMTVNTDEAGRFTFERLAAGRYTLNVAKPGYISTSYGARRYDRPGTPITVAAGQRLSGMTMRVARGSVIAGVIIDETGQPAAGVPVRAMQYRLQPGGERTLAMAAGSGALISENTDDRGAYRLYGLPPGEYVVVATPRLAASGDVRAMTEAEIRSALAILQQPASVAPGRSNQPPPAPAPSPNRGGVTVGYSPVYYPGTTAAGSAATVTVGPSEERSGVDFQLQLVRTATVSGAIVTPPGVSPQSVQLLMVPTGSAVVNVGVNLPSRTAISADGKFTFSSVAPGQYTINARTGGQTVMQVGGPGGDMMTFATRVEAPVAGGGGRGANANVPPGTPAPQFWGLLDVNVAGENLSDLAIALQPAMTLSGQVTFEGAKLAPPEKLAQVRINMAPVATGSGGMMPVPSVTVSDTGKFTATGLVPGKYRLTGTVVTPGALGQWAVKSSTAAGRDAIDIPVEIGRGEEITNAVVTFTDVTQDVSGMLQDASGRPAPDYSIIVFSADSRHWLAGARRIRSTRPSTDGRFTITGLPAGDYRIAALTDVAPNEPNDPAFLQMLIEASVPFSLAPGEKRVQDFKIGG